MLLLVEDQGIVGSDPPRLVLLLLRFSTEARNIDFATNKILRQLRDYVNDVLENYFRQDSKFTLLSPIILLSS